MICINNCILWSVSGFLCCNIRFTSRSLSAHFVLFSILSLYSGSSAQFLFFFSVEDHYLLLYSIYTEYLHALILIHINCFTVYTFIDHRLYRLLCISTGMQIQTLSSVQCVKCSNCFLPLITFHCILSMVSLVCYW